MKLWIAGANGFLGKAMQNFCKSEGVDFIASSKEEADISSEDHLNRFAHVAAFKKVTHIVNCAALAHVDLAEKNPDLAFRINTLGPENLGKLANMRKIPIIHISTEYIFNGCNRNIHFSTTDEPESIGVYASTKRRGELRLLEACSHACIIRTSWLFGGNGKTFLSSLFQRIKNEKKLEIAADQKGRATYVYDLVKAVFSLFNHQGIFHYANQGVASRYEIALEMQQCALECGIPICCDTIIPTTSDHFSQLNKRPHSCILDTSKYENLFHTPIRSWKQAVKDLVNGEIACLGSAII